MALATGSGVWDDPHFQLAAEHFGYIDHAPIAVTDREVIAFDDPEGYDNYRTHGAAHAAYRELLSPNK